MFGSRSRPARSPPESFGWEHCAAARESEGGVCEQPGGKQNVEGRNARLDGLAGGGARIRYHGDFGAGGITIANLIVNRHSAQLWRMAAEDHRRAVERLRDQTRPPTPLRGRVPPASWDPDLAESITGCGFEVTEEHVLDDLLDDLTAID